MGRYNVKFTYQELPVYKLSSLNAQTTANAYFHNANGDKVKAAKRLSEDILKQAEFVKYPSELQAYTDKLQALTILQNA